jgi:GT2 family glycosyltransferase
MKTSVLIVNWNSCEFLRKCLTSLNTTSAEIIDEIVVVDGASFDGCERMLSNEFPRVKFYQSPINVGFGRANNIGFRLVSNERVLLLNPDTEVLPGAINALLNALAVLPSPGILGPRLLNSDGSVQESCVQSFPTPINQALDSELLRKIFPRSNLWGNYKALNSDKPVAVEAVSGASMLLHSDTFRKVGGFSPEFFMYGEDLDLCAKVRRSGLRVYHVPEARLIHHGGGSSSGDFRKFSTLMMRNAVRQVIHNHRGRTAAAAYSAAIAMSALFRLAVLLPGHLGSLIARPHSRTQSLNKWLSIFRWSLGLENVAPPTTFTRDIPRPTDHRA